MIGASNSDDQVGYGGIKLPKINKENKILILQKDGKFDVETEI